MERLTPGRRKFIRKAATTAAGIVGLSTVSGELLYAANNLPLTAAIADDGDFIINPAKSRIRFSVIGINHGHIASQIQAVTAGGGEFVSFYASEPDLAAIFTKDYPEVKMARSKNEILEDKSVQLILSAAIPDERAPIGIEVKHGKDFMVDKPGIISLEQLEEVRRVQKDTGRIYSIMYSERLENPATVKAGDLVKEGAIGKVIQTIGLGPHRMNPETRPKWFFQLKRYGGILTDIGSHQFDQFLFFTGSKKAEVVAAQIGNVNHHQYPELQDFGDAMLNGDGGVGYLRVDWFTPAGLKSWGDSRLTILGTDGYIEIRKNLDIATREGGNHLFLVNQKETQYINCNNVALRYGQLLVDDVINRTETAMTQAHCFLATELALKAQKKARSIDLNKV